MKTIATILFLACFGLTATAQDTFWLGADISGTTDLEARSVQLRNSQGEPRECTALMRELGLNAVRLRVWVNPKDGLCSKDDVVRMARRARAWGMALMIDFHYSDWWADPGQQNIPAAWKEMDYAAMKQAAHILGNPSLDLTDDDLLLIGSAQWLTGQRDDALRTWAVMERLPRADALLRLGLPDDDIPFLLDLLRPQRQP